jgi:hypothetical protein
MLEVAKVHAIGDLQIIMHDADLGADRHRAPFGESEERATGVSLRTRRRMMGRTAIDQHLMGEEGQHVSRTCSRREL